IVTDDDGGVGTQSFVLTVTNVAPTINAGLDRTLSEGAPVTLNASVVDPGTADQPTVQWVVTASNGQVIPPASGETFSFTPVDNGTYQVRATVTDKDQASATAQLVITVINAAPTIALGGASTAQEGLAYALL